ncbi:MAG: DegT/DnrJ/EryC1/StrS family aminotransferase [Proteobacteria bacterium]|nr:DegT/DnrJ/EryC1/StrS family aminotransferase [Pseudomonadota bacterium]
MRIDSNSVLPESAQLTGRGSSALWAVLKSIAGRGRHVLMPVNICEIVIPVVLHAGFIPVFHDVDPMSGNATLDTIREAYRPGISICLATHNYGTPLDIKSIAKWAHEKGVFLIEDVCNALGAKWDGHPLGLFGDASIFSFGQAKIVDAKAGGALYVRDQGIQEKAYRILDGMPLFSVEHRQADAEFQAVLRTLRQNSMAGRPEVYRAMYNAYLQHLLFRPDEALLTSIAEGMADLDRNLATRREKASIWRSLLNFPPLRHRHHVPGDAYWRYTFFAPEPLRDRLLEGLRRQGVPASKWFPPVHRVFDGRRAMGQFPGAERFARECLNVFVDHSMGVSDIEDAAQLIRRISRDS